MSNIRMLKNIAGTLFLLASTFLVCSTFISMRIVLADPIAPNFETSHFRPVVMVNNSSSNQKRIERGNRTFDRSGGRVSSFQSRNISNNVSLPNRQVNTREVSQRNLRRDNYNNQSRARTVISRTANPSRISLQGNAVRGIRHNPSDRTSGNSGTNNKIYNGNYSNIIDPTTGLISADAYSNCLESYYTCMDEICTARNASQRRCACAGRIKVFADAEKKLESANEELIKASGQLALLLATKGKDVSSAFSLTDAEKVMNCVSYKEASESQNWNSQEFQNKWCYSHGLIPNKDKDKDGFYCSKPKYCDKNNGGLDMDNLNGSGSDILAQLKSWAESKDLTVTITSRDDNAVSQSILNMSNSINGITSINDSEYLNSDKKTIKDSLAETWGYDLFAYAHNNVCNRVLDSCFNGIYEACGTPPSDKNKCSNGMNSCPYNYNSIIKVNNTGSSESSDIKFLEPTSDYSSNNSASCFGYSGNDPYQQLRRPVADARRSILHKYVLDSNSDCDAYGEKLRKTAQNIGYQKVAAQQALQKKRMEFKQQEEKQILASKQAELYNFQKCIKSISDCDATNKNKGMKKASRELHCSLINEIPFCYQSMKCGDDTVTIDDILKKANANSVIEECIKRNSGFGAFEDNKRQNLFND